MLLHDRKDRVDRVDDRCRRIGQFSYLVGVVGGAREPSGWKPRLTNPLAHVVHGLGKFAPGLITFTPDLLELCSLLLVELHFLKHDFLSVRAGAVVALAILIL